jgi:hypothetical protein
VIITVALFFSSAPLQACDCHVISWGGTVLPGSKHWNSLSASTIVRAIGTASTEANKLSGKDVISHSAPTGHVSKFTAYRARALLRSGEGGRVSANSSEHDWG